MMNSKLMNPKLMQPKSANLKFTLVCLAVFWCTLLSFAGASDLGSLDSVAAQSERNVVKLYGAGGMAGLDAYQTGCFVSADGHILTVWSTVLDVEEIIAVSSDGNRRIAKVVGVDPNLEIAVLKTEETVDAFFAIAEPPKLGVGQRILAVSNLYGIATGSEMSSVQKGVVMANTELKARRGSFDSVYRGEVIIIDAMTNNPGAAGGALTDLNGNLAGMLGKELRDSQSNTWLNYAIPLATLKPSIEKIIGGESILRNEGRAKADRPASLRNLGVILIPNVLPKTPAFVDLIQPGSVAQKAGLKNDDLILFLNSTRIVSQQNLLEELSYIDRADEITLLVQRKNQLQEIRLNAR